MSKAHYYTCTTSVNDTGFKAYSQPFHSSDNRKDIYKAIRDFHKEFQNSKMKWFVASSYLDEKEAKKRVRQIKDILKVCES